MRTASNQRGPATGVVFLLVFVGTAVAQYGGGAGTMDDPYQIWTAEQMNAIGDRPGDWDKHFKLMADIDLGGYTEERFRIIGRDLPGSAPFSGSFDGNGHRIHHFTYRSPAGDSVGLFGFIRTGFGSPPAVRNLGLVDPNVDGGRGEGVAALVGQLFNGTIRDCYIEGGRIAGFASVGGLVGSTAPTSMGGLERNVVSCRSSGEVSGDSMVGGVAGAVSSHTRVLDCRSFGTVSGRTHVGGLVGASAGARIAACWTRAHVIGKFWTGGLVGSCTGGYEAVTACAAQGDVVGEEDTGGLVGWNIYGVITDSYAVAPVSGVARVGGLVGANQGTVNACYAAGLVKGKSQAGGLVGSASADSFYPDGTVTGSFWDVDASGQTTSAGGSGMTTAAMQTASTFLTAGWDFAGETANGTEDIWWIDEGKDYPRMSWEPTGKYGGGAGEPNDPYLIFTAEQLNAIGTFTHDWDKHFQLMADIDLSAFDGKDGRAGFNIIGTAYNNAFTGLFDGGGHAISNFALQAGAESHGVGLFGFLGPHGVVSNLAIQDANVQGDAYVGPLVGYNRGSVRYCRATGFVRGDQYIGGLIGICIDEALTQCCRAETRVSGGLGPTGGLVGANSHSTILQCSASGVVEGASTVGGITGRQDYYSVIQDSHSACSVWATAAWAGGIVGHSHTSLVSRCYSVGPVTGGDTAGGLVGDNTNGEVEASFWDVQTSGQVTSAGGEGKTTAEMQTARTFLDAGWDLAGEATNGAEDLWWLAEGKDYPRLWWEAATE